MKHLTEHLICELRSVKQKDDIKEPIKTFGDLKEGDEYWTYNLRYETLLKKTVLKKINSGFLIKTEGYDFYKQTGLSHPTNTGSPTGIEGMSDLFLKECIFGKLMEQGKTKIVYTTDLKMIDMVINGKIDFNKIKM